MLQSHTSEITVFRLLGTPPIHAFEVAHSHGKAGFMRRLDGVLFLLDAYILQCKSPQWREGGR